jgi:hypothetical protein
MVRVDERDDGIINVHNDIEWEHYPPIRAVQFLLISGRILLERICDLMLAGVVCVMQKSLNGSEVSTASDPWMGKRTSPVQSPHAVWLLIIRPKKKLLDE